jgi:hypothetical protein
MVTKLTTYALHHAHLVLPLVENKLAPYGNHSVIFVHSKIESYLYISIIFDPLVGVPRLSLQELAMWEKRKLEPALTPNP